MRTNSGVIQERVQLHKKVGTKELQIYRTQAPSFLLIALQILPYLMI